MKKVITFMVAALFALNVSAQGFDFDNAHDFYLLSLGSDVEMYYDITDKITQDYRTDGEYVEGGQNTGERFFDIWEGEWGEGPTLNATMPTPLDNGFFDQLGGYWNLTSNYVAGWTGGGGFQFLKQTGSTSVIDFTGITDEHHFHMGVRVSGSFPVMISLTGGGTTAGGPDEAQRAQFSVGVGLHQDNNGGQNLTPNIVPGEWFGVDVPVSTLKSMGWNNRNPITANGYFMSWLFQITGVYNVLFPNANFAFDGVFFYKPGKNSSIKSITVDQEVVNTQYFTIDGRAVSNPSGLVIAKQTLANGSVVVEKQFIK